MSDEAKKFRFDFDKSISAQTVIGFLVFFWALAAAWVDLKRDVDNVETQQIRDDRFRIEVRSDYITKEQLNYMVIDRLDQFEESLGERIDKLERKIDERNGD